MIRPVHWRVRAATKLLVAAVALWVPVTAQGGVASLNRVTVLPSGDRASLVVEATDSVPNVSHSSPTPTTFIVEAGPMNGPMPPQELVPEGALPCIAGVSVSGHTDADRGPFLRVRIRLIEACRSAVRSDGRRIYVDFAAMEAAPLRALSTGPPGPPPTHAATPLVATLRSDILRRARTLAAQADVKGLMGLRDETVRQFERLGQQQSELLSQLLGDLDGLTNDARALRLKLDGIALKKEQGRVPE